MWPWKRRERFSLEELRYLTEQLQRTSLVNDLNKDSVIEILRSIAELMIWGDHHDISFFELFMEKQVMLLLLHILKLSTNTTAVAVQLLQSISIMIQNIQNEHAIYYIFSNGYLNHFITYPFDFHHEELLAYYISFLRTISTKLDRTTVSFFIRTENDEVVSFPLYTEGIKFFRHEESMVRIAVRTLTLNVYHVEDATVRKFVTSDKVVGYIGDVVKFLREKCLEIEPLAAHAGRVFDSEISMAKLEGGLAETEEILDYCNDIICAGIPDLSRVMTEDLVNLFVVPALCSIASGNALAVLYSLARALHIVKHKPLANGIAGAVLFEATSADGRLSKASIRQSQPSLQTDVSIKPLENGVCTSSPREILLSFIISSTEDLAFASVSFLLALLHSEVDDTLLDLIGLLPRLKQHKRRLLHALMGSNSGEELLFSDFRDLTENNRDAVGPPGSMGGNEEHSAGDTNKESKPCNDLYGSSSRTLEVAEKLLQLVCRRPPPSPDALCRTGSLLWQIFPDQQNPARSQSLQMIRDACRHAKEDLLKEMDDCWCDFIPSIICDEWKACKKALEAIDTRMDILLFSRRNAQSGGDLSSSSVAERVRNTAKVFCALHQLQDLLIQGCARSFPLLEVSAGAANTRTSDVTTNMRVGTELELSDAIPCRIAFERGKERAVYLLPMARDVSGWLLLAEDVNSKPGYGSIRVIAPLSGCMPEIDEEHPRWLHLRIRPPSLPSHNSKKSVAGAKVKRVDGRWTLAFSDVETCKRAKAAVLKALSAQKGAVQELLQPLLRD